MVRPGCPLDQLDEFLVGIRHRFDLLFGPIRSLHPDVVASVDVDVLDAVVVQEQLETTETELGGDDVTQHEGFSFCGGCRHAVLDHPGRHLVHGLPGQVLNEPTAIGLGTGCTTPAQNAVGHGSGDEGLDLAVIHRAAHVGASECTVLCRCSVSCRCSFTDSLSGWSLVSGMESESCVVVEPDRETASSAALVRAHLASVVFELAHPMAFLLRADAPLGSCGTGGATLIVRVDAISSDEKPFSPVGCTMNRPEDEAAVSEGSEVFRWTMPARVGEQSTTSTSARERSGRMPPAKCGSSLPASMITSASSAASASATAGKAASLATAWSALARP